MKKSSAELKRMARETLTGRYRIAMLTMLAATLIPSMLLYPFSKNVHPGDVSQNSIYYLASFIITLIELILSCGLIHLHLNMARNKEYRFSNVAYGFRNYPQKVVLIYLYLLLRLFPVLLPGSVVLILALTVFPNSAPFMGIAVIVLIIGTVFAIKISLRYGLVYYLFVDHPASSVRDIFKESKRLMDGNILRLLYLDLSFLGFILLAMISCGVGMLWVGPYMAQTSAYFYLDVLDEKTTVVSSL